MESGLAKNIMNLRFRDMQLKQMCELHELLCAIIKRHINKRFCIFQSIDYVNVQDVCSDQAYRKEMLNS